jgi:hypothetical protein
MAGAERPHRLPELSSRGRLRLSLQIWLLGVAVIGSMFLREGHSFQSCKLLAQLGQACHAVQLSRTQSVRRLSLRSFGAGIRQTGGRSAGRRGAGSTTCAAVTEDEAGAEQAGKMDGPEDAFADGEGMAMTEADENEARCQANLLLATASGAAATPQPRANRPCGRRACVARP